MPVPTPRFILLVLSLLATFQGAGLIGQVPVPQGVAPSADVKPVPEAKVSITRHELRLSGSTLRYTAIAGTMLMRNEKEEPIALFGFTSYTKDDGDRRTRPLLFAYNGGPGSASIWLHMGILGPKRTLLNDLDSPTTGPFRLVDNEFTILEQADLVMIDPVGTGFSRPVGKSEGKDFFGVDQDIKSVSEFIVQYLSRYGRWASPKFILGESYGGTRTGGVSNYLLTRHQVALNGIILVSPYMDFIAGNAGLRLDLPYINFLPAYAATAWYHKVLAPHPPELQPFLREVERFAQEVYAPALLKGHRLTPDERTSVLASLARYTGISADYWDRADLRISEERFTQELLRQHRMLAGRIDSRFKGGSINPLAEVAKYDPFSAAIGPAIVATFNDYYRQDLQVVTDQRYIPSSDIYKDWDERHQQPDFEAFKVPFGNTAVDLAQTMTQNPNMKVLVQQGYFDLATPYAATNYFIDHLDVAQRLRTNVTVRYYQAGHMMYIHAPSMKLFKQDLAAFIDANSH